MCGIAGYLNPNGPTYGDMTICAMLGTLKPRGPEGTSWLSRRPDDSLHWRTEESPDGLDAPALMAFGCSRLAIQDVSDRGLQPIANEDKTVWVVQNGEIFNFIELRQELTARGHTFRTGTDTEVIVHAYEEWGPDCFSHFNGKFAIAIYDHTTRQLILARDRLGVTPLFFCLWKGRLAYASEIKALMKIDDMPREPNRRRLAATIGLPYKLHGEPGETMFDHIFQVMPGERITFSANLEMDRHFYWSAKSFTPPPVSTFKEARAYLRETLIDAVKIRLRADRRVAFIVSGGVDSPAVVGIASKECGVEPETFSLDLPDERFNENDSIREVIDYNGVKSNFIGVTPERIMEVLPQVVGAADEPLPTPNGLLHGILSQAIHDRGYKVVLNGVGGDEVFLGYHDHFLYFLNELEATGDPSFANEYAHWQNGQKRESDLYARFVAFLKSDAPRHSPDFLARSRGVDYRGCLNEAFAQDSLKPVDLFDERDDSTRGKQVLDLTRLTLPYALKMDDGCYMGRAVESRQPFLDYRLVELGLSLPPGLKMRKGISKFLLRSAVRDFIPPARRRDHRKIGLNLPIDVWMRGPLKSWIEENLCPEHNPIFQYANHAATQTIINEHMAGDANHNLKLWDLVSVNMWLSKYF